MRTQHICFISEGYPTSSEPIFTFVARLVEAIADTSIQCTVIAPQSITKRLMRSTTLRPRKWTYQTEKRATITVLQPYTISFSGLKIFGKNLSFLQAKHTINKCLHNYFQSDKPDVVYGHFWHMAYAGYSFAKEFGIHLFVATGESRISIQNMDKSYSRNGFFDYINGVICVSSKNLEESVHLGLTTEEKCVIFPNGYNPKLFHKLDKQSCRKKIAFPYNAFICIFVGYFNDRKGINRVDQSLIELDDRDIYVVYIGSGDYKPTYKRTLFVGKQPHDQLITYYNAADVFVLPTLHEGCCNAIVEALACGLPVISSDRDFNKDILNESNSIMIDPISIQEIKSSILELKTNSDKCTQMGKNALESSKIRTIENRSKSIIDFITS